jgi:cytochrome c553
MSTKSTLLGIGSAVATLALVSVIIGGTAGTAMAKPEYAQKTGKACGACHANPSGGGKLTAAGEKYKSAPK